MYSPLNCDELFPTELELNIVEVFSPSMFYFHLKKDWDTLDSMIRDMNNHYFSLPDLDDLRVLPSQLRVGMKVAVVWKGDNLWHRGIVRTIESVNTVEINYIDYGSRTVTLKTRIYHLLPQFCNLPKMCFKGRLHGIISLQKKWTFEASRKFDKMVMNEDDEREIVLNGTVMVSNETMVELQLVLREGLNIGDDLVAEGHALYSGQEASQVPCDEQDIEAGLFLPVLSSLGDHVVRVVGGSFPQHFEEEVVSIKKEALALKAEASASRDDISIRRKCMVNKAVGLLINTLMEVKPLACMIYECGNRKKQEVEEDSTVDSKSEFSIYPGTYTPISRSDEESTSSRSDICNESY